jgi:hypothetical protein
MSRNLFNRFGISKGFRARVRDVAGEGASREHHAALAQINDGLANVGRMDQKKGLLVCQKKPGSEMASQKERRLRKMRQMLPWLPCTRCQRQTLQDI